MVCILGNGDFVLNIINNVVIRFRDQVGKAKIEKRRKTRKKWRKL
jgi:hypothetical protein